MRSRHSTTELSSNGITYSLLNGLPRSVTVNATPTSRDDVDKANIGLFGQDQWTVKRVTINAGVRFDYYNAYAPAQHLGPGPQVPTRNVDFPAVYDIPNWKNVSPRLGRLLRPVRQGQDGRQGEHRPIPAGGQPDDDYGPSQSDRGHRDHGHADLERRQRRFHSADRASLARSATRISATASSTPSTTPSS